MAIRETISVNEMNQEIDLAEIYGREPTREELSEFAELARDEVISRTQSGEKRGGGKFQQYSEKYAEFKGSNDVDLTLFGDMLDAVDAGVNGSSVNIFINDELETKKGYNHHVGDTLPERPWFGLTEKEARDLAGQVKRVIEEPGLIEAIGSASLFQEFNGGLDSQSISEILVNIGLFND